MARRRFFVPAVLFRGDHAVLPADQSHHLRHVLRIRAGEEVEIFDGTGESHAGTVEIQGETVRLTNLQRVSSGDATPAAVVLAAALIKPDRFEWILQKGTELGINEFVPLITRRGSARIPGKRLESRMQRWRRIVQEACKQCGRNEAPAVTAPHTFVDFVDGEGRKAGIRLLLSPKAVKRLSLGPCAPDRVVLCVGPEGGWDPAEEDAATDAGFESFSLGRHTLRAETASLAAVAIVQHELAALDKRADNDTAGRTGNK